MTFHEVGLSPGVSWGVNFSGIRDTGSGSSLKFTRFAPGTFNYEVTGAAGYTPLPASGTLALDQSNVSSTISFQLGTEPTYPVLLNVTSPGSKDLGPFTQVLFVNLTDGVSFSSMGGANISFSAPNGNYDFSAQSSESQWFPDPRSGEFQIDGASVEIPVELLAFTFNLTFVAAGLPANSSWNLTVVPGSADGNLSGMSASLSTGRWNGTFDFSVNAPSGYAASPNQGTAWIQGSNLTVTIEISPRASPIYAIIFSELGLSNRSGWGVSLDGDTQWVPSGFNVTFYGPVAQYSFVITVIQGYDSPGPYTATPSAGEVYVTSGAVSELIYFSLS